jgi:AcrR family transcriptional regulator
MSGAGAGRRSPGRKRRFDPDTELRLVVDAAKKLLRENDYEDVSVGAILDESGLSTRSFYRHFGSKDDLLISLYRQNAVQAGEILARLVESAGDPRAGVEAWIDGMLRLRYDTRTARQVAIFGAPSARRAVGYNEAEHEARELLIAPLRDVLAEGRDDGSFPLAQPDLDARSIYALVWDVMRSTSPQLSRAEARRHVLRFALCAVGARWVG